MDLAIPWPRLTPVSATRHTTGLCGMMFDLRGEIGLCSRVLNPAALTLVETQPSRVPLSPRVQSMDLVVTQLPHMFGFVV